MKAAVLLMALCFSALAWAAPKSQCTFGRSVFGWDVNGLQNYMTPTSAIETYTENDIPGLRKNPRLESQILAATNSKSLQEAFDVDDGEIDAMVFYKTSGSAGELMRIIRFYAGGTLAGAIFTLDGSQAVIRISDGDFEICDPAFADQPVCGGIGSKSQGWFYHGQIVRLEGAPLFDAQCQNKRVICRAPESKAEGWYAFDPKTKQTRPLVYEACRKGMLSVSEAADD